MAGGEGGRFWPLSIPECPKQFIGILGCGRKTLIQLTVDCFQDIAPNDNYWVVTNARHVEIVKKQIPSIPASHVLAEPEARNTCWKIKIEDENVIIVVTPSDAVVMNPEEFHRVIKNSLDFSQPRRYCNHRYQTITS